LPICPLSARSGHAATAGGISPWVASSAEIARYTKAVDQKKLAATAMEKTKAGTSSVKLAQPLLALLGRDRAKKAPRERG
jgi:hypothetical protein